MLQTSAMKQLGIKNMGCVVEQMEWSNKMDLIAFSTDKGEVIIQRLNWQKIVTFPSPGENIFVRSLGWQLDETIVAVGYSNGRVSLLDAEREDVISNLDYEEDIKTVFFSKAINATNYKNSYRNQSELSYDFFLPTLPSLSAIGAPAKTIEYHKSFAKGSPCFLVIIMTSGKVHFLLLGALKAGTIDLKEHVAQPDEFEVYDVRMSGDFNTVYALVRDGGYLKVLQFHNEILEQYISPMLHLSEHCANILETKNYINNTIQCILESWETVLIEMDNKLTKYANQQPEGSLSADFLELLVFGYATHEIEEFLMEEITEKGLKKLANSVDLSYSTIQNLVTKPMQSAAINMFYFLNTIKGLGRIAYFFEPLITTEVAEEALRLCGAFLIKVLEMQQVIDQSVNDMKLFFCWLCVVIVRLHQQDVTEDMSQISPEDTIYLAEYLNSFEDCVIKNYDGTVTKRKFNLEKVGQYLENKNLQQMAKADVHHLWNKLVEENECLGNCTLLYPHEKELSLIQQRDKMFNAIDQVLKKTDDSISASFELNNSVVCSSLPSNGSDFVCSSYNVNTTTNCDVIVTTINWNELLVLEFNRIFTTMRCTRLDLRPGPFTSNLNISLENLRFVDLQFYNENILSILLQNEQEIPQSFFLQLTLDVLNGKATEHALPHNLIMSEIAIGHSLHDSIETTNFKNMDGICTHLAVSGSRKVATLLSDLQRKMTIFEMEVEEDDEDTEMSQNSLLDMSKESAISSNE
ncbi:anaphase-promoting complex subunit 4 [Teleopsis dalmanni]|uniref:anaphase-promoting complex subunit 4 n=1 Tax=Teleopsis dalmanni TaxID=139649 RepID=UPI0018CC9009|nr:anaphase-promoting complex subunit 4 [Teleopsis dalmanni]